MARPAVAGASPDTGLRAVPARDASLAFRAGTLARTAAAVGLSKLRILLVEDDAGDALLVRRRLEEVRGATFVLTHVATLAAALRYLAVEAVDALLLDLGLPDSQGVAGVARVTAVAPAVPVVVLTGLDDEEVGAEALHLGAQDHLPKNRTDGTMLWRALLYAVERQQMCTVLDRYAREAQARATRVQRIITACADAMVVFDRGERVLSVNPAAEALLERSAVDLVGERFALPTPVDEVVEIEVPRRSGVCLTVEIRTVDIEWEGEHAYLSSIRDVTARKRAERELVEVAEASYRRAMAMQTFHHAVSHELRTPLSTAREFLAMTLEPRDREIDDTRRRYLELAKEACDQMAVCVEDLVDATRIETGKFTIEPQVVSGEEVVHAAVEVAAPRAEAAGVRLRWRAASGLSDVVVDPVRVRQVLGNLLGNALKFTPPGGEIAIDLDRLPGEPRFVVARVRDTGPGIGPEHQARIFERHYQVNGARPGGLGLGLGICQEIVALHGGRIWVESEVGRGSVFAFTLPVVDEHAATGLPRGRQEVAR